MFLYHCQQNFIVFLILLHTLPLPFASKRLKGQKKRTAEHAVRFFVIALRHLVQFHSKAALFVSGVVLMENSAAYSLVDNLDGALVCFLSSSLITGSQRCIILFHKCTHTALEHLIMQSLEGVHFNALLCRLDIRHFCFLLFRIVQMIAAERVL